MKRLANYLLSTKEYNEGRKLRDPEVDDGRAAEDDAVLARPTIHRAGARRTFGGKLLESLEPARIRNGRSRPAELGARHTEGRCATRLRYAPACRL
jgi:hypothetical protein